jgi:hypothetical protein
MLAHARTALAAAIVVAAVAAPGAHAAAPGPSWLAPLDISNDIRRQPTDLVVTPDGTMVMGQMSRDSFEPFHEHSEVVVRSPGGSLGAPQELSSPGAHGLFVRLASDELGNVAAAFTELRDGTEIVRVAVKPAGGPFGPARDVSDPVTSARFPEIGIGGGHVVVTWAQDRRVRAAVGEVGGGAFTLQSSFSAATGQGFTSPRVAVAASGAAVIAWDEHDGDTDRLYAAARPANGALKALPVVRSGRLLSDTSIAMTPGGQTTLVWTRRGSLQSKHVVESASRGTSGDFGPVDRVSDAATESSKLPHLGLAVSAENTAYAVWHAADGWYASVRPASSAFGAAQRIPGSTAGDSAFAHARVAAGPDGSARALWSANLANAPRGIESARLEADGTIGPTQVLAATAPPTGFFGFHDPPIGLGIDDEGNAATAWRYHQYRTDGSDYQIRLQLERFDAAPPRFGSVTVPEQGIAGQPVEMTASAADRWSTTKLGWDFGDGSTLGQGETQSHVFAEPGAYEVEVVAADESFNGAAEYRTVVVRGRRPNG